ncbi:hypothetical protein ACA910_021025 [Epithemia clementina (nom. ined.)]
MYQITPPMHFEDENFSELDNRVNGEFVFNDNDTMQQGLVELSMDESHPHVDNTQTTPISLQERRSPSGSSTEKINWSLAYSSDEESQKSRENRALLHRSYSDPSLEESMLIKDPIRSMIYYPEPRRRSRSSCSRGDEELAVECDDDDVDDDVEICDKEKMKPSVERGLNSLITRSFVLCTPPKLLCVLFVVCFYTTFFLPYPGVRPQDKQIPHVRQQGIPLSRGALPKGPTPMIARASPAMFQARAFPELELTFRPGLEKYYEQEAFSDYAWTKYANMFALGSVLVWAVFEFRRRAAESVT